jgi:hypothetical protein
VTDDHRLDRRSVLAGALAFLGATAAPDRSWPKDTVAVAATASRLGADAAEVGRLYLEQHGAEADLTLLADLVSTNLDPAAGDVAEQMSRAVSEDFRRGTTITVDGWLLSRTEARICAIAYLAGQAA